MANKEHVKILGGGLAAWNAWRKEHGDVLPDLSGADLSRAEMSKALLSHAELRNAFLKGAILADAEMDNANLRDAGLEGANLSSAILERADLSGANLRRATLIKTGLNGADLRRADLTGADLSGAYLTRTDLTQAILENATLCGAVLEGAILVETDLTDVDISKSRVYGSSVWNTKGEPKKQSSLIASRQGESEILVDNLEMAHFVYLMVNHRNLQKMLNTFNKRGVLILGPFKDGGLEFLQRIASELRKVRNDEGSYLPIIFDFERPGTMDYTETIITLAGLSRFVIAELSGPSVGYELAKIVPEHKLPFVCIGQKGRARFSMIDDLRAYQWFLGTVEYTTSEELITCLRERIVEPAERKMSELRNIKSRAEGHPVNRQFIRHPADITIEVTAGRQFDHALRHSRNIGIGGLAFQSDQELAAGTFVELRISLVHPAFETKARVVWCQCGDEGYDLGVEFLDPDDGFRARMVEQICHFEDYRKGVFRSEGRELTAEQAAIEWVGASEFP